MRAFSEGKLHVGPKLCPDPKSNMWFLWLSKPWSGGGEERLPYGDTKRFMGRCICCVA